MEITVNQAIAAHQQSKLKEAEKLYRSILENQPTNLIVNNNLGVLLYSLGRPDEVEASYRKAIEVKPDYAEAYNNLGILPKEKELMVNISEARKFTTKNKINNIESGIVLSSNPFITHRNVETRLLNDLYNIKLKELDKTEKKDARYGNGKCTDFTFFKNDFLIVKNIEADLINIMKQAVKSNIYIFDSFLNIYKAGSGTTPHHHINFFDKTRGLVSQKYSLTYYLSVGDQNCSEPGNLQLYDPSEEIKLSEGMVVIIPACRKHCAIYNGGKDRIMIGINFYSLI